MYSSNVTAWAIECPVIVDGRECTRIPNNLLELISVRFTPVSVGRKDAEIVDPDD
jgi:hypothetical protein